MGRLGLINAQYTERKVRVREIVLVFCVYCNCEKVGRGKCGTLLCMLVQNTKKNFIKKSHNTDILECK